MNMTQAEIAEHLDMSDRNLRDVLRKLNIDHKKSTLGDIRLAYIRHLRGQAAGHMSDGGMDLTKERVLTERIDRQIKEITLKEKQGQYVEVSEVEPAWDRMFGAFRAELQARDEKLKMELHSLYGVEVDITLLNDHTREALTKLGSHDVDIEWDDAVCASENSAAASDID